MASRAGRDPDILFLPGDVEVSKVKGHVYLVYGSAAPRGPFVNIDEVGGNLYLLDTRHLDREMGADAVTRGTLIRGMASYQTSHTLGCLKIATPTCKDIILVHSSFSSCKIGRVMGDFVPINGHLPAFLSIQRWQGRFFSGVSEGMLPNRNLLFVCKTLKDFMNKGRLSPYANDGPSQRPKALPARPTTLAVPPAGPATANPVTPRQDGSMAARTSRTSSPYLSEGEILPGSVDSQLPLRSTGPLPDRRTSVIPFIDGVKAPATWTADPSTVSCGNCHHRGHQIRECIGPVDILGFIGGCPVCNSGSHYFEKCHITTGLPKALKDKLSYLMLCVWRQNKPPIRSDMCWVTTYRTEKSRHTLLPVPASESLQKFRSTWKDFNYKHCYGNPNLNDRVLPLNATVLPKPGSESRKEMFCKQKAADMAANKATEATMTKTAKKQATKVTKDVAVKSTKEAAAKAEKSLISPGTLAKAPNLKRKALATPEEPESDVKKQKMSFSPDLPHRPKQAQLSPALESWAGDWLERTFTVKQENESEVSGQDQVVRVKQEPRNE